MNQVKIGNLLRELRKEKGLTQEQLGEQFHVSSRTVSRWENGNNMPDLTILVEMSKFYEIGVEEIIDGKRKETLQENELQETLEKVADYSVEYSKKKVKYVWTLVIILLMVLIVTVFLVPTSLFVNDMNKYEEKQGDISKVVIRESTSSIYSKEDIDYAITTVEDEFINEWGGTILDEIYYIGDERNAEWEDTAAMNGADEVMVIAIYFTTDNSSRKDAFLTNQSYENWLFILVRRTGEEWRIVEQGF